MPPPWRQYNIEFQDRETADRVAVQQLGPTLAEAEDDKLIRQWWFVRKQPWRLRLLPSAEQPIPAITQLLDRLTAEDQITGWAHGVYEPETVAFGGAAGMDIAHALFNTDSRHLLTGRATPERATLGQRETSTVLISVLLRAAGLDWYEQGDVWARVAEMRPASADEIDSRADVTAKMHTLMTVDGRALGRDDGPLGTGAARWVDAFEHTGQALADLSRRGRLHRGLRAVLAHHVIFHFNRAGLAIEDQSTLVNLASGVVFGSGDSVSTTSSSARTYDTKVNEVTLSEQTSTPDDLRGQLVQFLSDQGLLRSAAIENAFRTVPRHLFLPGVPLEQAYANTAVYTKTAASGESISAISQPWIVAMMLGQLDAQPGDRIMEAGAGTGYNAALIGSIVGDDGHVVTIDVDDDLVAGAREHLAAAGVTNVQVILADGALGHPQGAPYDRVIATVGAYEVPPAWLDQLDPHGRLVVPLRLRGTATRSVVFERDGDGWVGRDSQLAVFMPLRGIGDDARRYVHLTQHQDVTLQVHSDQDVNGHELAGVLDTDRHEEWTGVVFPPETPYEWMELWLCLRLDNPLMRMNVKADGPATQTGRVTPMLPWGSMATVAGGDLAYLLTRVAPPAPGGGRLYEIGVAGHGPHGKDLAARVADEVRLWDADYRARTVRIEIPDEPPSASAPDAGAFVLPRPHTPMRVTWA